MYCGKQSESEAAQSCLTLCNPVDRSPPGSSIHGILQARVLRWVAISFSSGKQKHWHFQVFWFKSRQTACFCQQVLLEYSHAHLCTSCLWLFSSCHGLKAIASWTAVTKKHTSGKTQNIYYLAFMWQVYWPFIQEYSLKTWENQPRNS